MSITAPSEALGLDLRQQNTFVTYFNNLPEKPSSTVRFFNHTDFYSLYGEDAKLGSDCTKAFMKYMGDDPRLSYIVLKIPQFEQFVRELLLVKQYRVEVYVKKSNKVTDWTLEYTGSPGNLSQFEDVLFGDAAINFNNYVMGVKIVKGKVIAVACVNCTELKFEVCEITDNECFTELEALIAQIGPKECIIPQGDSAELTALQRVLKRNNVLIATMKKNDFSSNDVLQELNRLLFFHDGQQRNATSLPETESTEALGCLNAVIKFLNLTSDEQNFNQFKLNKLDTYRFVRLDNAALFSLNILPKLGSNSVNDKFLQMNSSSKSSSLLGVLDTCITNQGKRLLEQWIKQPLKDYNLINERYDIVECLVKNPEIREPVRQDCLSRLPDLLHLARKLSSKKATLQDCYRVYQIIGSVPKLIDILKKADNPSINSALIDPINEIHGDLEKYQAMIEEILDLSLVDRGEFLVKKSFDPELAEIYERKMKIEEKMQKLLRRTSDDLGFQDKTVKLECTDQHGYFFRVTLKEEKVLRKNSNYEIIGAVKGGVRFTNDKLSSLNVDYTEARQAYEEQQKTVIAEILEVAGGYKDSFRNLNMYIAMVDVLASFANVAVSARVPYVRPKLHKEGSGILKLEKLRHPCIEQQDQVSFIPNNAEFNRDNKTFHIITGPNMCGKSTYIRSIGVCVLMAQIGCLVPCDYAEISLVDAILSRVGAEDCQLKGLSTFMLEMIETSTIIKTATSNSLVIIDELGRGTSTYDGCGIAWAIAEYLATEVKCFALFATHFHEITRLAEQCNTVNNLYVTAATTDKTITPLYQVREGACDNSYGIHCATMVQFPEEVIQEAIEHQKRLEHAEGTQFIATFEPSLKRKAIKEGDEIIDEVLKKVKTLKANNLSEADFKLELEKIKNELNNCNNLFVKGLLSKCV